MQTLIIVCTIIFPGVRNVFAQSSYPLMNWDFNGKSGQKSVAASFVAGGLTSVSPGSVASLGSGMALSSWYTTNGLTGRGTVETLAQAVAGNKYISFVLTPVSSKAFSVTAINFVALSQNRARKYALFSSAKGFTESDFIDTATVKSGTMQKFLVPDHLNLQASTEFRLYIYGINEGWETYGLGNRLASQPYDLSVEGFIPDEEPPVAPNGLSAKNIGTGFLDLSWNASTDNLGVAQYEVFKDGLSIGKTTSTAFQVKNLTKSTTYSITVKAIDAFGNYSSASDVLEITTPSVPTVRNNIGINLSYASDWGSDHAFADVMHVGREWYKGSSWGGTLATVDSRGWPTEDACLCIWQGVKKMNGTYKLKFTGSATSITAGWASLSIENKVYDPVTNTTTADLIYNSTGTAGICMAFKGTNGGVKDVKLMRPVEAGSTESYDYHVLFTKQIKTLLSKFSVIRFLDWELANGSNDSLWEDRTPVDYYSGSFMNTRKRNQTWETMIQLCNETNSDAWINVPVKATDDYIRHLALLWKEQLNPNLKVYVEFSNEMWNSSPGFTQFGTNIDAALSEVAAGNSSLNFDGEASKWYLGWRRVAKRIVEISNLFREVWGDDNMMTRIRPVLMWQQGDGQATASSQLIWLDHYSQSTNKPINYYLYGAGGSAYYAPDNNSDTLTIDNIWKNATYNTANWQKNNNIDLFLATAMGCKRLAYEGGPSMDNYGHSESVKATCWMDPRMKDLLIDHHDFWSQYGGDLLMYYASTGTYQWGFSPDSYDLNTPKFQAIDALNESDRYPVATGLTIPFSVDGNNFDYANPGWSARSSGPLGLRGEGRWGGYLFRSGAGSYNVSIQYAGAAGSVIQFVLDGSVLAEETVTGTGTTSTYTMNLSEGLHTIRIRQKTSANLDVVKVNVAEGAGLMDAINELKNPLNGKKLIISPNPARSDVRIISENEIQSIAFVGLDGRISKIIESGINEVINISDLQKGLYIVRVKTNRGYFCDKLVVK